jgi:hypothetical protein
MRGLKSNSIRLFTTLWLACALVLSVGLVAKHSTPLVPSYTSAIISNLTIPVQSTPINTISELAEQPLPVASFGCSIPYLWV